MTKKHSKHKDKAAAHNRRGKRRSIRCYGAMAVPRRGLIFAQGRAIQQAQREELSVVCRPAVDGCQLSENPSPPTTDN